MSTESTMLEWFLPLLCYVFSTAGLGIVLITLVNYLEHIYNLRCYPAGPFPLPVIGNLHLLRGIPHDRFKQLVKKYGLTYSFSFGMNRIVIVNGYEAAREALLEKSIDFAGRPRNLYTANLTTRNGSDIAFGDFGPKFLSFRKVVHRSLKMYGDGMGRLEKDVLYEAGKLTEQLRGLKGEPVDPLQYFSNAVINIICFIVFGHKYEFDDPEFKTVMRFNSLFCQGFKTSDYIAYFPWLRIFPNEGLSQLKEAVLLRDTLFRKKVEEHKRTLDGSNVRNFLDSLLLESRKEIANDSSVQNFYTDEHIDMILNDVFTGGGETVVTTLRWTMLYLMHNPDVQKTMRKEIDIVLGSSKGISLDIKQKMPYMNAVIQEVLRMSSVVPLGVPHKTTCSTSLSGFPLPAQTHIYINIWGLHHDEVYWKDPFLFNPNRWLDENGALLPGPYKSFFPFSAGRRVCLGESLAKVELFLFLTCIVKNFDIQKPRGCSLPSLIGIPGIVHAPYPYRAVFRSVK